MFSFEIDQHLAPANARLSKAELGHVLQLIAQHVPKKAHGELSIAFVAGATIRKINRERRKKDEVTDVLSFQLGTERAQLGEVLICFSQAKRQAKEHGWSVHVEIINLIIHGVLHTLGFDHETASQQKRMLPLQKKILSAVC